MTNQNEVLASLHDIVAANQEFSTWTVSTPHLVMLWEKAQEAERQACAKVAEAWDVIHPTTNYGGCIANAIRARGEKE